MKIIEDPEKAMPGDHVKVEKLTGWPRMSVQSAIAFRRFTGANHEAYNLVRKGPRIFACGTEYAKCVYNHTREF
jgi:hypothetical protein